MNISKTILNIGGRTFPCKEYLSNVKTDNWMAWLPGIGELGPADGSQIDKVDLFSGTTPVTWTAQASKGFEFNFNILAIQLPPTWDYWAIQNTLAIYLKEQRGAKKIGVVGYSLGARGCWTVLQGDSKGYIDFIAPVAGFYDFSQGPISNLRTVPVYGLHGDKDTTMPYSYDVATQQQYDSGRPTQTINGQSQPCYYLQTIAGASHNIWQIAFDVTPGKDQLLQWVNQQFGVGQTQPQPDPMVSMYFDPVKQVLVIMTQSGKKISINPLSIT